MLPSADDTPDDIPADDDDDLVCMGMSSADTVAQDICLDDEDDDEDNLYSASVTLIPFAPVRC